MSLGRYGIANCHVALKLLYLGKQTEQTRVLTTTMTKRLLTIVI